MTDIVERLRKASVYEEYKAVLSNLGDEAADEIERLRKLLAATNRDLDKTLTALDHHLRNTAA